MPCEPKWLLSRWLPCFTSLPFAGPPLQGAISAFGKGIGGPFHGSSYLDEKAKLDQELADIAAAVAAKDRLGILLQNVVLSLLIAFATLAANVVYEKYIAQHVEDAQGDLEDLTSLIADTFGGDAGTTTAGPPLAGDPAAAAAATCACGEGFDQIREQLVVERQQTADELAVYQQQTAEYQQQAAEQQQQMVALMAMLVNATLTGQ